MRQNQLTSPYPWFGGKSTVADLVWSRFGDVNNYVEPFFGSGAMLLLRPRPFDGAESVNDLDGMVANFWRAIQEEPERVAKYADWPVNECDLLARHAWLVNEGQVLLEQLRTDPGYFNCKIAGWWVWGLCQWIGSGWCKKTGSKKLPELVSGRGVHRRSLHVQSQLPHLGSPMGDRPSEIQDYFKSLAERMRRVRVCCGDWSRICGPTPTQGLCAVFLDPPYDQNEKVYTAATSVSSDVRNWCIDRGGDRSLRIALCGYAGEGHEELESKGWSCIAWKAVGGWGNLSKKEGGGLGKENANRERIWFSPHCLKSKRKNIAELME